jgi:hypothetical protein
MSAISGDTTTVSPSRTSAGSRDDLGLTGPEFSEAEYGAKALLRG